jgi:hypothetical protein
MPIASFSGSAISNTYQRIVQTDGTYLADGTGSILNILNITASYALNAGSGGGGGSGSAFPFTGSAGISGSIDLNGPLNVKTQAFNIDNNTVVQYNILNTSSINLNTYSNQPTYASQWSPAYFLNSPYSITSGSVFTFYGDSDQGIGGLAPLNTLVFFSGSQSDSFGISGYKFLGVVSSSYSQFFPGGPDSPDFTRYYAVCVAYITTSSLDSYPYNNTFRFYNTGSQLGGGTINLNGSTNITGGVNITNNTSISGSLNVSSSITSPLYLASGSIFVGPLTITNTASINNTLIIGNNNSNKKYLQFGSASVGLLATDPNLITLSRNIQNGFDVLGNVNTRIQFNQGYDWQYTLPEPTETYYGINTTSYLDFKRDNVNFNIIELNYVGQGYNTQLNDGTAPLLPAKGFSTNYNGTAYLNITGSVSASSYYGNGSTLTGVLGNPFTGTLIVNGTASINGVLTSSIANLDTINSLNGINTVYISKGSGSRTTNLVVGDSRALSVITPGASAVNGQNNIAIGSGSLLAATTTLRNIALGNNVMPAVTNNVSNSNIGIGFDVFISATNNMANNMAIGVSASSANTSGKNNIAIGNEALFSNTTQFNNIAVGLRAGRLATAATSSIFIGVDAGTSITTGNNNIAIGFEVLKTATTSTGNLVIGTSAMVSSSATLASNNTSIGYQSLQQITGSNNVALGYQAMQGFRSGSNNTVIGYSNISGSGISGSNNTIIGANVVLPGGVYNNRIIIADGQGNQIISTSGSITTISGSLNVTGSGAIFTLQPQSPLPTVGIPTGSFAVSSSIPAKPFFWDGSVWNALY